MQNIASAKHNCRIYDSPHFRSGEIVDVVVMRNSNTNRSRCFGFVKYATEEQLQESQANRPHVVDGKEIDAKRAVARTNPGIDAQENNRNSGDQRSQNSFVRENQHPSLPKIYVGGIKEGLEEIDLKEYFSTFGLVKYLMHKYIVLIVLLIHYMIVLDICKY